MTAGRPVGPSAEDLLSALPEEVTLAQFGELVGLSTRNVSDLAERGIAVRSATKGRIALVPSLRNYIANLREKAAGRAGGDGGKNLAQERAELTSVQREREQILLDQARGKLISRDEAVSGWTRIAMKTKSTLLGLTSRIGFAVPHLTAHDRVTIGGICREALFEIASELDGDPVAGSEDGAELVDVG